MKKSLLLSILIHAVLAAAAGLAIMVLRVPEKPSEPVKIALRLSIPSPHVAAPSMSEPVQRPEKGVQTPKQPPKQQQQLPKPAVEKAPTPVAAVPALAPLRAPESPVKPIAQQSVNRSVQTAVAPKEPAPAKAAAEPAKPDPKVKEAYLQYLRQTIDERKIYPKNAKRLRQTGIVMVKFTLMAEGTITNVAIADSSGFELLDQAASDLLKDISRVRPLPQELGHEPLTLSIPIQYTLR